jgi:hypothetical protein
MTRYIEVYGTMPEAREYIAEEFGLPVLPPPISVIPPQNIRRGPIRTITYYPEESLSGFEGPASFVIGGIIAFALASIILGRKKVMRNPEELAVVCAWCKRMRFGNEWAKGEPPPEMMITHGMCPQCAAMLDEEIEALEDAPRKI